MSEEYVELPEVYDRRRLNTLYREIPLKDNTFRTLRKYFGAMANLYGVIPMEKACEIIKSQCPRLVTEDEFWAFVEIARHECEGYCVIRDDELFPGVEKNSPIRYLLVDNWLLRDDEDYLGITMESQQGKPYYIPDKQELLRYANFMYREETPELIKLSAFVEEKMKLDVIKQYKLWMDICEKTRYYSPDVSDLFPDFEKLGVTFETEKQVSEFMRIYQDFSNNTRMQCNRGFTPKEIYESEGADERVPQAITLGPNIRKTIASGEIDAKELLDQIMAMDLPNESLRVGMIQQVMDIKKGAPTQKVGRNDPCPCGSGKKFKKCCGRNL